MDITRSNFLQKLPEISDTIRECDFIAIDTELSGLMRDRSVNRFDLPEERFSRAVESSRGYFIMQFGISCFTRSSQLQYTNRTYNFYIFPQANDEYGDINRTFSLQAHAIQFLTEHNFDFNKLFKHGVSYLTFQEKTSLTEKLKSEMKDRSKTEMASNGLPKFVPEAMVKSCTEWLTKVKKFVEKREEAGRQNSDLNSSDKSHKSDDGQGGCDSEMAVVPAGPDPNRLDLTDCSTNHKRSVTRRLLECQPIFDRIEIGNHSDEESNETYLFVNYISKKDKFEKQKNALIVAKGFLEVLELVILNKKPLVGHNLHLDLIQIINQFVEPLSDHYSSFKEICHSLFPYIYDTKHIAHAIIEADSMTNNTTRLNDLYCQLKESDAFPRIQIEHLGDLEDENQMPHQAGYDAYMSGYCFLALCESYMQEKRKYKFKKDKSQAPVVSIAHESEIIREFSNKIHMSFSYDYKYYNLNGDEEEPDRDHVFYVEHPHTWALDDLFQLFKDLGGVTVNKLSRTAALCALRDPSKVGAVIKKAKKLLAEGSNHRIFTYNSYLENFKPKRKRKALSGPAGDSEDVEFFDAELG